MITILTIFFIYMMMNSHLLMTVRKHGKNGRKMRVYTTRHEEDQDSGHADGDQQEWFLLYPGQGLHLV